MVKHKDRIKVVRRFRKYVSVDVERGNDLFNVLFGLGLFSDVSFHISALGAAVTAHRTEV
jgi:hypothetical protein